jgi:hypothetical protein
VELMDGEMVRTMVMAEECLIYIMIHTDRHQRLTHTFPYCLLVGRVRGRRRVNVLLHHASQLAKV